MTIIMNYAKYISSIFDIQSQMRVDVRNSGQGKAIFNKVKIYSWMVLFSILIHFDSLSKGTNRIDSFWLTLIFPINSIWSTSEK